LPKAPAGLAGARFAREGASRTARAKHPDLPSFRAHGLPFDPRP
jgi:hypothetical protein